jgi:3-dehydroquinate dehydratase/shikimate dehydrogenase
MLFLCIPAKSIEFIQEKIKQYEHCVDGFEIRWDFAENIQAPKVRELTKLPLIFTMRSIKQGGNANSVTWDEVYELAKANPNYLDLEYDWPNTWFEKLKETFPHIKLIASYHHMQDVPTAYPKMPLADLKKIACFCPSSLDALRLLSFSKTLKNDFILIGMGEKASFTRVMNLALGSEMTFASLPDEPVAPGQLNIDEMNAIYRVRGINTDTQFYALLGNPVSHSIGHLFHNDYFEKHQINARYVKIELEIDELAKFLDQAFLLPFQGLSITMPLKLKAFALCSLEDGAKSINTLVKKNQKWLGYNTDILGLWQILKPYHFKKVIILGAGGAGLSLYEDFKQKGFEVYLFNRSPKSGVDILSFEKPFPRADLIINTLPTIEYPIKVKLQRYLCSEMLAIDFVYAQHEFSDLVKACGMKLISGLDIFYQQANLQQEIWQ